MSPYSIWHRSRLSRLTTGLRLTTEKCVRQCASTATNDANTPSRQRHASNLYLRCSSSPSFSTIWLSISLISSWWLLCCLACVPVASKSSQKMTASCGANVEHDAVTIALSKKESAEHLEAMGGLYDYYRGMPLLVKAYALDGPNAPPASQENVKVVHFVRHGQGFHNLMADMYKARGIEWEQYTHSKENPYILPEILDAPLTEKGRQQAYILQPMVQKLDDQVELVVLSPNCRALQTGVIVFQHLVNNDNVPFLAHEMVREENGVHVCDKRRPTSLQQQEFPMVDFSLLESEEDALFREDRRETKRELGDRIYNFFEWLSTRPEKHVAVASHSGWLFTIFNMFCECDESLKPWFQTGEMRSVKLEFTKNETPTEN